MVLWATLFQLSNGVIMLLDRAPLEKAALHQFSGVLLLSAAITTLAYTRMPFYALKLV